MLQKIGRFLLDHNHFLISSHSRPDGDSIGTQLALAEALEQLGKTVEIANRDPHPPNYRVLPGVERIRLANPSSDSYDGLIILECNNLNRTGVEGLPDTYVINIDHHPSNDFFGNLNWVDPAASAVAEMVYELLIHIGVVITNTIATNLYAAIMTDTGSFQFSNTSNRTFKIVSELVQAGASPSEIAQSILQSQSRVRIQLLGELLHSIEFNPSGTIAWISLFQSTVERTGASPEDTEGLVNYPLNVEGVELCAFFREQKDNGFRISLRSKGDWDVGSIAEQFGGGGHRNAAGLSLKGKFDDVRDQIINQLERLISLK